MDFGELIALSSWKSLFSHEKMNLKRLQIKMKMTEFCYQRVMASDFYSDGSPGRTNFPEHGTSADTGGTDELKVK